jgi:histidine triad (HIT) family protein
MVKDCIFCKLARGGSEKRIYENENFFSVPDISPAVKGHSLVISKKHFETVLDLPSTLGQELLDCIKNTAIKLMVKEKAEGFNVANNSFKSAGQIIGHVHFHIFPRKKDDGMFLDIRKK